ncbi:MAG: FG-GAP repeat protein [Deltaproteobacteria bacterium]|nr:FG-GAP repeat protein [Deltaproteobacteria bacterium]
MCAGVRLAGLFFLLALVTLGGCTAELPEGQCVFNEDCAEGLVCVGRFCRAQCRTDGDCSGGGRCVSGGRAGAMVCVPRDQPSPCLFPSDCPAPMTCSREGQCQAQCQTTYDCEVTNPFTVCVRGSCGLVCREGTADCDGVARNGCETQLLTDPLHCGSCGTACRDGAHATGTCATGRCALRCEAGYDDCDRDPANGCEADLSDPASCGRCGNACPPEAALCAVQQGPSGPGYACAATCRGTPSDQRCGAACVDTTADPRHCGRCDNACPAGPNASATCVEGVCGVRCTDTERFADCDGEARTGCEAELPVSASHCGRCGQRCMEGPRSTSVCMDRSCAIVCEEGYGNCDAAGSNGCETDLRDSVDHCGLCSSRCPARANATATCAAGRCGARCQAGFGDCNADASDGCEADTLTATAHCGGCGRPCAPRANAAVSCAAGACVSACSEGFADCDGEAMNGCEADTRASAAHCGACGRACAPANARGACAAGRCAVAACNAGFADCDGDPANGCEVDTRSNALHCGRCANRCSFPGAGARCDAGACVRTMCAAPTLGDCDGVASNGCETDLQVTAAHCGACGAGCMLPNATAACRAGGCVVAACNAGFADCDGAATNGCEASTATDARHCGACGRACSAVSGAPRCAAGACAITCDAGFGDCDGMVSTGCETRTSSTVAHCGACGVGCAPANAVPSCSAGRCGVAACRTGFADCDGDPANGCEVNLLTDPRRCGACGTVCSAVNGAPRCAAGACGITCNAGYGDCDGMASTGCETDLRASAGHCGACGRACSLPNATAACAAGGCVVASCNAGFGDCNGDPADGCETSLVSSPTSCGACGRACSLPNASAACVAGACAVGGCSAGFDDCDRAAANGCEVNLQTSNANCGGCGRACAAGTVCSAGGCSSVCASPTTYCAGACVTLATDVNHCGACGRACAAPANATASCAGSTCGFTCRAGFADCDGVASNGCEVDLGATVAHCGACGRACDATNGTASCAAGACGITCAAGFGNCDGSAANGCETDLRVTAAHCGACGAGCSLANATPVCAGSACGVGSCNAGYGNCDGVASNGCETDTRSAAAHCGACGRACDATNGTASCASSACGITCNTGFGNCDGLVSNGCETNLRVTVAHCGACGAACSLANAAPSCASGVCAVASCNAGFGNCDGVSSNGCEVNLTTTAAHCGACGRACALANATAACASSACVVASCNAGFGDCNGAPGDGCEVNTNTTAAHCGGCGRACSLANATATCAAGACAVGSCNAGFGNCDGVASNGCEVNTQSSNAHCGGCGRACAAGTVCSSGSCASICSPPTTYCAGSCVNLATDVSNCGACGAACSPPANATATCAASACGFACLAGFGNCDGVATNGCETDLTRTPAHCGACGAACDATNGTASCASSACGITCNTGFGNCDGLVSNGCETNTSSSASNCGACGNVCSFPNASAGCRGGACALGACNTGFGNCDAVSSNGCETNINSSATHCGACGNACSFPNAGASCASGACALGACNTGYGNCDGVASNGCEVNTTNTVAHCGACGNACAAPANGTAVCSASACDFVCNAGYYRSGTQCVGVPAPRQLRPLTGTVNASRRPRFVWANTAPATGARLQVCRNRLCTLVDLDVVVAGTSYTPTADLSTGMHYWRAYGAIGSNVGLTAPRTFEFFVGARTTTGRDGSTLNFLDVSGDGDGDAAVGEYYGARVLVFTSVSGVFSTTATYTLTGPAGSEYGSAVANVGDIDGNGFTDLVVGAPGNRNIYVHYGSSTGLQTIGSPRTQTGARFGSQVVGPGDLNADGYSDVLVGDCDPNGCGNTVYVYYGSLAGLGSSPARIVGPTATAQFGRYLTALGEVNNDDFSDFAVGAFGTGLVYVYHGGTSTPTLASSSISFAGASNVSVAGLGDINGDGYGDLGVGGRSVAAGAFVRVYRGTATGISTMVLNTLSNTGLVYPDALTGTGDVNGDGYGDLAVRGNTATVEVFLGGSGGVGPGFTQLRGGTNFGAFLGALGDFNLDNRWDLLVGAPDDADTTCQGRAHVHAGNATSINTSASVTFAPGGTACWNGFGRAVSRW